MVFEQGILALESAAGWVQSASCERAYHLLAKRLGRDCCQQPKQFGAPQGEGGGGIVLSLRLAVGSTPLLACDEVLAETSKFIVAHKAERASVGALEHGGGT
mmetsp:Transcript_18161/g.72743  ORF Transcript_18161/g.72743 Transcript_18161/m.72743 type:complete len:102 (-) Transcript_18161:2463-2768(-)